MKNSTYEKLNNDFVNIMFPRLRRGKEVHETWLSNLKIIVYFRWPGTISVRTGFSLEPIVFINSKIKNKIKSSKLQVTKYINIRRITAIFRSDRSILLSFIHNCIWISPQNDGNKKLSISVNFQVRSYAIKVFAKNYFISLFWVIC